MKKRLFIFTDIDIAIFRCYGKAAALALAVMALSADATRVEETLEGDVAVRRTKAVVE